MKRLLFRAALTATIVGPLAFVALFFAPFVLVAEDPMYINFSTPQGSVKGESQDPEHKNWVAADKVTILGIEFNQANLSVLRQQYSGDTNDGKPHVGEITIVKTTDSASPKLFQAAASNTLFTRVTIDMLDCTGQNCNLAGRLVLGKSMIRIRRQAPNQEVIVLTAETVTIR